MPVQSAQYKDAPLAVQRRFRLFDEARGATLARMDAVKYLLNCGEDTVLYLIHDRQLVAFDLAAARAAKRVPGVWTSSIALYQERRALGQEFHYDAAAADVAIAEVLPAREFIGLTELTRLLGVTAGHLHHLIDEGALAARGGDRVSKAPKITRASAAAFWRQGGCGEQRSCIIMFREGDQKHQGA